MGKYVPINSLHSPRFCGVKSFMRLPNIRTTDDVDFVIVGLPFDTGATYRAGARFAPGAIRENSVFFKNYNEELDIHIFDYLSGVDYGDVDITPGFIEESYKKIEEDLTEIFAKNVVPICMGGCHSVTLPELRALCKTQGPVALIHFDSHSDTFDTYLDQKYCHATPFRRAVEEGLLLTENSIQVGLRSPLYSKSEYEESTGLGLEYITGSQLHRMGIQECVKRIRDRVKDAPVFLTFDIDFLDPAYAPGTGTPEVGGFTSWEAMEIVRGLRGLNFKGFDLVEVLPAYDQANITALAGAAMMWEFISLLACKKADEQA